MAGDWVELSPDGTVIDEIRPRKNVFVRPPIANLDALFIVASTVQPVPSTLVLDQLAAAAIYKDVQPILVVTKADLGAADTLVQAYKTSGIPLVQLNYETGEGLDEIKAQIKDHLCAFCGNSGVGKSTLLNALAPELQRETGSISQKLGRGRHTTREVEIFEICGGRLADTPGFASLEAQKLCRIPKEDIQHTFPEFEPYFGQCRFTGCSHRAETDCAVRSRQLRKAKSAKRAMPATLPCTRKPAPGKNGKNNETRDPAFGRAGRCSYEALLPPRQLCSSLRCRLPQFRSPGCAPGSDRGGF